MMGGEGAKILSIKTIQKTLGGDIAARGEALPPSPPFVAGLTRSCVIYFAIVLRLTTSYDGRVVLNRRHFDSRVMSLVVVDMSSIPFLLTYPDSAF